MDTFDRSLDLVIIYKRGLDICQIKLKKENK